MRRALLAATIVACTSTPPGPDGVVVASNMNPGGIVTDNSFVYWCNLNGGVYKTPLEAPDSPPISLVDRAQTKLPAAIARDDTTIYWADAGEYDMNNGSIGKVDLASGTSVTLVPNIGGVIAIAVDATRVYFTSGGPIFAVPKAGGLIQRIAIAEQTVYDLAVDSTHLYWPNFTLHAIRSLDLTNPDAVPVTIAMAGGPEHIAIDATSVYWVDTDGQNMLVHKAPLAGGDVVTLDKRPPPEAGDVDRGVVVANGMVYWATLPTIMRVSIDGTGATTLADHNNDVQALAVGPSDVFWGATRSASTAILRVTR
jgi:hypothetical protein